MEATTTSRAPLTGVRVLDLTRLLPGPVCTLHLADLGADVIKIEDTGAGDYAAPALRKLVHRNKQAIRLDLKQPDGVTILKQLAANADVLVEGFRPGVMDRLGVGYDTLAALNPKLVYCSITGFGQSGPLRDEPGHDINYCALSGVADQLGAADGAAALSNLPIADLLGGSMSAVMGVLAALFDAARTGRGRHVDVAMADAALAHAVLPMVTLAHHGQTRRSGQDKLTGALPCYGMYATADGRQLAVGALEPKFWVKFCEVIDRPDLAPTHFFNDETAAAAVRAEVAALIVTQPLAHWTALFEGTQCCVTPVLRLEEALRLPQFAARDMVLPDGAGMAFPVQMSDYRFEVRNAAPAPGQDTDALLDTLGYDEAARTALRGRAVVG